MLERIKKNWNKHYLTSVFFMSLCLVNSGLENMDKSMMYFAVAMGFMGLGEISNQIRDIKDKK